MSGRRSKKLRSYQKDRYEFAWQQWRLDEPPRWRFISHRLWRRDEPKKKEYMR